MVRMAWSWAVVGFLSGAALSGQFLDPAFQAKGDGESNTAPTEKAPAPLIPPEWSALLVFEEALDFREGLAPVKFATKGSSGSELKRWGYLSEELRPAIAPAFDAVRPFSGDAAFALTDGKWGLIDKKGDWCVPPQFDAIGIWQEGKAAVRREGRWGFAANDGSIPMKVQWDEVAPFSNGYARVRLDDKWTFLDATGETLAPPSFDKVWDFSEGWAPYALADGNGGLRLGFLGTNDFRLSPAWDDVGDFHEGLAVFRLDRSGSYGAEKTRWGWIGRRGQVVIPAEFLEGGDFQRGLARFRTPRGWGYLNRRGEVAVEPQFLEARDFFGPRAAVKTAQGWAFVGTNGQLAGPFWHELGLVRETWALASVLSNTGLFQWPRWGRVNAEGRWALAPVYEAIQWLGGPWYAVRQQGRWGVAQEEGVLVVPPVFDEVSLGDSGWVRFRANGKWGFKKLAL